MKKSRKKIPRRKRKKRPIRPVSRDGRGSPIGSRVARSPLGERLTVSRLVAGLSLETLAGLMGTSPAYLSNIETGKVMPSIRRVVDYAAACKVDPGVILLGLKPADVA